MADRSAIFVDAGYLLAAGGQLCCGTRSRAAFNCDYTRLMADLADWVKRHSDGMQSLRTYWYDGAINGVPTAEHERIGGLPYVKVRLGRIHSGQQKGVDALIYRDLMTLARERAIARAYLLSGDEDLREGVVASQDMGVQVILLGVPTSQRTNQSAALVREADDHIVLDRDYWERYFSLPTARSAGTPTPTEAAAQTAGRAFAIEWLSKATSEVLGELIADRPRIPGTLDYSLISDAEKMLGPLRERQDLKKALRAAFWSAIDEARKVPPAKAPTTPD
ncbi:MAG TPA: NYN domain-containing protein [Solirubrobacteraceae bacterium]|nr:NYN domain-containing protein [Solirubrobacteraceae bacterium]